MAKAIPVCAPASPAPSLWQGFVARLLMPKGPDMAAMPDHLLADIGLARSAAIQRPGAAFWMV